MKHAEIFTRLAQRSDPIIPILDAAMDEIAVIVLGNSGYDCISDHSASDNDDFEQIMDRVIAPFCELYEDEVVK